MTSWKIEFKQKLKKQIIKLGKKASERIIEFLEQRIIVEKRDPRSFGEALHGNLSGLWKYRVGDYRIICELKDNTLTVLVLEIDHRKKVYKRKK
ncbi:MAG: type II toxin-antitoxin system RelE/ParE family toxin [Candidatus Caenarcaniphilales bacterium]|nr:type II toxin-antitoxin system RelE/ParE family toxin [Candidatus Caenarcaniphilales bacterium]